MTMAKNNLLTEELNYIGRSKTPTHLHLCTYTPTAAESHDGDTIDDILPLHLYAYSGGKPRR